MKSGRFRGTTSYLQRVISNIAISERRGDDCKEKREKIGTSWNKNKRWCEILISVFTSYNFYPGVYTFRIFFLCATEDVSAYNIYPVLFLIKNPKSRLDREESTKQLCLATSSMRLISLLVYLPQHQSVSDELFFFPSPPILWNCSLSLRHSFSPPGYCYPTRQRPQIERRIEGILVPARFDSILPLSAVSRTGVTRLEKSKNRSEERKRRLIDLFRGLGRIDGALVQWGIRLKIAPFNAEPLRRDTRQ